MELAVYPWAPMLRGLVHELPADSSSYVFEPKWDGYRCLVFRDGDEVDLLSRNDRPFARRSSTPCRPTSSPAAALGGGR